MIGFDDSFSRPYIGGDGGTICYFDYFGLEWWTRDLPSPIFGFPSWISVNIPGIGRVTGGTAFSPYAPANPYVPSAQGVYGMPSFVGSGGQCVLDQESQWQCFTAADGLPFDDIRGYGIVHDSNVEWFMSADSVASRGMQPQDQIYSIPELVGAAGARPTWLSVPYSQEDSVWVGTDGYGVIRIVSGQNVRGQSVREPSEERVTQYTTADGLPGDTVRDVQSCGWGCAWVATADGVGHWDGTRWKAYTTRDGLPSNDVRGVSSPYLWSSRNEYTWAATAGGPALLGRDAERWQSFPDFPAGVEVNGVMGGLFSTRGQGLIRFIPGSVAQGRTTSFTTADGLPSDQITALAATANGILVGTPLGAAEGDGHTWSPITGAAVNDASSTAIATEDGLWAWDGHTWQQVNSERITFVAEEGWYATPDQVCRWMEGALIGAPYCPTTSDGEALAGIQVLYTVPQEGTVIAIDERAYHWVYDTQACRPGCFVTRDGMFPPFGYSQQITDLAINDLAVKTDAWLYASEKGVYSVPIEGGSYLGVGFGDYGLTGGWPISVRQMSLDETTDTVWVATNQGAFYADRVESWAYVAGLLNQDLTTALASPGGDAWFGTPDAGLIHFEPAAPGGQD